MKKTLNDATRLRQVPSVGTDLRLPDNLPSLFPEITCTEAIEIAEEFTREGEIDKKGFSLLWHMADEVGEGDHLPDCPCRTADRLYLADKIRRFLKFAE
jgi:hypothetical protein